MAKRFLLSVSLLLAAVAVCMLTTGCMRSKLNHLGMPVAEYLPAKAAESDDWGLVNAKGEFLVEGEFKNCPGTVFNGYFAVDMSNPNDSTNEPSISVLKADKGLEPIPGCENLNSAGVMKDGIIPIVHKGERIKFVNAKGEERFTLNPIDGQEVVECSPYAFNGLITITMANRKQGYVNTKGEIVVKPEYDQVTPFFCDFSLVGRQKEVADSLADGGMEYTVIDTKGQKVFKVKDSMYPMALWHDMLLVVKDEKFQLLDMQGQVKYKLPAKIKSPQWYNEKYIIYYNEDYKTGVMTLEGETVIKPVFESVRYVDGNFLCKKEGKDYAELVTPKGEVKEEIEGVEFSFIEGFGMLVQEEKDGEWAFYNAGGKRVGKEAIELFIDDYPGNVVSDYFNATGIATEVVEAITQGKGFFDKGIRIGETAGNVPALRQAGAENYLYENFYECDSEIRHLYILRRGTLFDDYIATRDYWYDPVFNSSATIDLYYMSVAPNSSQRGEEVYKAIVKAFKDGGYIQESTGGPFEDVQKQTIFNSKTSGQLYACNLYDTGAVIVFCYAADSELAARIVTNNTAEAALEEEVMDSCIAE